MKIRFFAHLFMGISLMQQPAYALSPHSAMVATGLTTFGIAVGSYLMFKRYYNMSRMESLGLTTVLTAPLGYLASTLWFGLTPEMRYLFAAQTNASNEPCIYATREYKSIELLLEDVQTEYNSRAWLVDLHEDMVRRLLKTRSALKKWTLAQEEESVAEFSWIDNNTYLQLYRQHDCLEHNLLLLRMYKPFQAQHNAWIVTH